MSSASTHPRLTEPLPEGHSEASQTSVSPSTCWPSLGRQMPPSLPPFLSPPPGPVQLQLQAWPGQFQGVGRVEGSCLALEDKVTSSSVFIPLGHHGTC